MKGLILYIVSVLLAAIFLPMGIGFGLLVCFYQCRFLGGLKKADTKLLNLAIALDQYGNDAGAELLNAVLITKDSVHRYGNISETISHVTRLNKDAGTLTKTGKILATILISLKDSAFQ